MGIFSIGLIIVLLATAIFVAYVFIRFSIVSSFKRRGAEHRLREPQREAIEPIVGFGPPVALIEFFRYCPFVESVDFHLMDYSKRPVMAWPISGFVPLTARDVKEWRKISRVPGIPLANDWTHGMYFIDRRGAVMLQSPEIREGVKEVAASITELSHFEPRYEVPPEAS